VISVIASFSIFQEISYFYCKVFSLYVWLNLVSKLEIVYSYLSLFSSNRLPSSYISGENSILEIPE